MAYSPPVTFGAGAIINSTDLNTNQDAARKYINVDIIAADLEVNSFDHLDIQKGEAFGINDDHQFATGGQSSTRKVSKVSVGNERRWHTATVKPFDPQNTVKYMSVSDMGREIYMEAPGHALVEVALYTKESANDTANGLYKYGSVSAPKCVDSPFYLALDGAVQLNSVSYAIEESGGTPTSNSVASGLAVSGVGQNKKFVTFSYMFLNLSQGWHTIQVVVNARNEKGFVSHRMFNVEQFYIGGYSPSALANVGTTRKLSNKTF